MKSQKPAGVLLQFQINLGSEVHLWRTRSTVVMATGGSVSEMRVLVLGFCWSERKEAFNLMMGRREYTTKTPCSRIKLSGYLKDKLIALINTPDLPPPDAPVHKLKEYVDNCVRLSDPGPHVFLLVLQPEDFTEEHQQKLCRALQLFGHRSFDHSLVLMLTPAERRPGVTRYNKNHLILSEVVRRCKDKALWQGDLNPGKLATQLCDIFDQNSGAHVSCNSSPELAPPAPDSRRPGTWGRSTARSGPKQPAASAFRIVPFGDSEDAKTKKPSAFGQWRQKQLPVVKAPELLSLTEDTRRKSLNLVLCGRSGAGKISAAEAILGQRSKVGSASGYSVCVKHQGDVCGRQVSLVELPALYGKPLEEVMEVSHRCICLCDPEGVHAFFLVLPVGPITDEDEKELETVQKAFGAPINDFMVILFTAESEDHMQEANEFIQSGSIQWLLRRFELGPLIVGTKNKLDISRISDQVEINRCLKKPCSYTTQTFAQVQIKKIIHQEKLIGAQQAELQTVPHETSSPECLRIVLIGKTGSGKSTSGNKILGINEFEADFSQKSVTKHCKRAESVVDGRPLVVVDTPGLFDNSLSHQEVNEEMVKCLTLLAPGPHVFLLVMQIGRFTPEDKETLKLLQKGFGKESEKFTIILLTNGDVLRKQKVSNEEFIDTKCDGSFKMLLNDCGGRFHVFDNADIHNRTQASQLLNKMDSMVKANGGRCYTNTILQEAEAAIQKEMERILRGKEEEMRREKEQLQRRYENDIQKMRRTMEEQRVEIDQRRKLQDIERENYIRAGNRTMDREHKLSEYEGEKEKQECQRKKEDRIKEEQGENSNKELEEKFSRALMDMKKSSEEEARKQAAEINEFRDKYIKQLGEHAEKMKAKEERYDFLKAMSTMKEEEIRTKHREEIYQIVKAFTTKREYIKKFSRLLKRQDKEHWSLEEHPENLQKRHEAEMKMLIEELDEKKDKPSCFTS